MSLEEVSSDLFQISKEFESLGSEAITPNTPAEACAKLARLSNLVAIGFSNIEAILRRLEAKSL